MRSFPWGNLIATISIRLRDYKVFAWCASLLCFFHYWWSLHQLLFSITEGPQYSFTEAPSTTKEIGPPVHHPYIGFTMGTHTTSKTDSIGLWPVQLIQPSLFRSIFSCHGSGEWQFLGTSPSPQLWQASITTNIVTISSLLSGRSEGELRDHDPLLSPVEKSDKNVS